MPYQRNRWYLTTSTSTVPGMLRNVSAYNSQGEFKERHDIPKPENTDNDCVYVLHVGELSFQYHKTKMSS